MAAPCDWDIDTDCCPGWADIPAGIQAKAQTFATRVLWALSGRQFGGCPVTVRPCGRCIDQTYRTYGVWTDGTYQGGVSPQWVPYIDVGGNWRNCGCAGMCCCEASQQVALPGPVMAVSEVRVNNVVIPAANYRVDIAANGKWVLVGENGQVWPDCQNFDNPAASPDDTFVVTYVRGTALPDDAPAMVGILACEFAKLCTGAECALSPAATSLSRDGVTYEILSAEDLIKEGLTSMPVLNQWIISVNPHRLKQRPRVWSPDLDTPRMTVIT